MDRMQRVIVVGAGIGGLTTALLMAARAEEVVLCERDPEPAAIGAGIMLQPNGLAVLDGLGLAGQVRDLGRPQRTAEIRNHRGRLLSRATTPDFGPGLDEFVAVRRSTLHAVLLEAVEAEPRIDTRFGATVTAALPDGRVWFGSTPLSAQLVVGADGVGSLVRSTSGFERSVRDRGTTYVRALVPGSDEDLFTEYWTPLGAFGAAPVADDLVYCYAAGYREPAASALQQGDLRTFAGAWAEVLPFAGALLNRAADAGEALVNGVRAVRCRRWVHGRVALLGDAAHAMAPNLGQGANSAMVDAAVLTDALRRQPSIESALTTYDSQRRPAVTRLQSIADLLARLSSVRGRVPSAARDSALRAISRPRALDRQIRAAQQEDPARLRRTVAELVGHES